MTTFVDRDFEYHRAIAQLWLQISLTLSDQPLIPFSCTKYADRLTYYAGDIKNKYEKMLTQQKITLGRSWFSSIVLFSSLRISCPCPWITPWHIYVPKALDSRIQVKNFKKTAIFSYEISICVRRLVNISSTNKFSPDVWHHTQPVIIFEILNKKWIIYWVFSATVAQHRFQNLLRSVCDNADKFWRNCALS